mmetsp:Transcript_22952/g.38410  ORF Transcript_22952/g.38410 Transcript_22952/m.38410 type:complete len:111 (-) Transcript_22952:203-535(-)
MDTVGRHKEEEMKASVEVQMLKDNLDHILFVQKLIEEAETHERINYQSYLKALQEGLLDSHQGRYIYISKGRMLNKSFKRPHDVIDYFPDYSDIFSDSIFIYVPIVRKGV